MGRVFIPEIQNLNEEEAEKLGELIPLVPSSNCLGLEPDTLRQLTTKTLSTYTDGDFLLLDGRSTHCAVAASVLAVQRNSVDLLVWDKVLNSYLTRPLAFLDIPSPKAVMSQPRAFIVNDLLETSKKLEMPTACFKTGHDPDYMNPEPLKARMIKWLRNTQKMDYIVMSGGKLPNTVASCIMARMHGRVNYLMYNAKSERYEHRCAFYPPLQGPGKEKT